MEQSYQDFEIILVNDGSKDVSGEIYDKYATEKEYEKITTVHKDNRGPIAVRKKELDNISLLWMRGQDDDMH